MACACVCVCFFFTMPVVFFSLDFENGFFFHISYIHGHYFGH